MFALPAIRHKNTGKKIPGNRHKHNSMRAKWETANDRRLVFRSKAVTDGHQELNHCSDMG